MVTAVRLMYAGAAFTLIYAIGVIAIVSGAITNHPGGDPGHGRHWAGWPPR